MSEEKEPKQEIKEDNTKAEKEPKIGFFKKVWYSITKIEKYPDMAAQGVGSAISYLAKVILILAIVLCMGILYQAHQIIQEGVNYLQNEFPEFSYNEGKLDIKSEDIITISEEDSFVGKAIIDTKTDEEKEINKYINEITESGNGIIILKDKVILKNQSIAGTINYDYNEMFKQMGINNFTKQDVINYAHSSQIVNLYISIFLTILIYSFIMYFLTTISNIVLLSVFGYLTTWIAKIRMRYVAVFNMSVYAFTLSIILNMIYVAINIFVEYSMEYFQVMYVAVAAIYLVAAIFILKADFMKKQAELIKIEEAEAIIKKQLEEKEKEEEEKKKDADKEKKQEKDNKDVEKKKKQDNNKDKGVEGAESKKTGKTKEKQVNNKEDKKAEKQTKDKKNESDKKESSKKQSNKKGEVEKEKQEKKETGKTEKEKQERKETGKTEKQGQVKDSKSGKTDKKEEKGKQEEKKESGKTEKEKKEQKKKSGKTEKKKQEEKKESGKTTKGRLNQGQEPEGANA